MPTITPPHWRRSTDLGVAPGLKMRDRSIGCELRLAASAGGPRPKRSRRFHCLLPGGHESDDLSSLPAFPAEFSSARAWLICSM